MPLPKITALRDAFPGSSLDPALWTVTAGTPIVASGTADLPYTTTATAITTAGLYDLTGASVFARVDAPDQADAQSTVMQAVNVNGDGLAFVISGSNPRALRCRQLISGGVADETAVDYDPVAHLWWRLSEAGGTAYWDTSPDGADWTNQRAAVHGLDLAAVALTFSASSVSAGVSGYGTGTYGAGGYGA